VFKVHRQNHGVCTQCSQCAAGRQSISETDTAKTGRLRHVRAFIQTRYGVKAPDLKWHHLTLHHNTYHDIAFCDKVQEAQLMLTTGSTRLAVSRGQQTWYRSTCYIQFPIVQ